MPTLPHSLSLTPMTLPILSARSAFSCHLSGTDFCWPALFCGHPAPGLTNQFQGWFRALETDSIRTGFLPKYSLGIRQMVCDFQSEQSLVRKPLPVCPWWCLSRWERQRTGKGRYITLDRASSFFLFFSFLPQILSWTVFWCGCLVVALHVIDLKRLSVHSKHPQFPYSNLLLTG